MSAELNLSELRPWLDLQESYAKAIPPGDPRSDIARQMLAVIATARSDLLPSADSTANYVPNKEIIGELGVLRDQAVHIARARKIGDGEVTTMSDWSKVTRPIPVPNEWTKPFWDAARQEVLALQRCQSCKHFQHPPYATCVNCISIDLKFEPVAGQGAIYAYTIMYHTGDKRFASAVPYASIIVELDAAPGALLTGNLLEAPYTEAKVGRRVEVVFQKLNDDITLPQFRLARAGAPA